VISRTAIAEHAAAGEGGDRTRSSREELVAERPQPLRHAGLERIRDPRPTPLPAHNTGLAEDPEGARWSGGSSDCRRRRRRRGPGRRWRGDGRSPGGPDRPGRGGGRRPGQSPSAWRHDIDRPIAPGGGHVAWSRGRVLRSRGRPPWSGQGIRQRPTGKARPGASQATTSIPDRSRGMCTPRSRGSGAPARSRSAARSVTILPFGSSQSGHRSNVSFTNAR